MLVLFRNERAQVSRDRPHVAVRELVPGLGERVCELLRMIKEALRDRRIVRVHLQGEVRREHSRGAPFRGIMGVRNGDRRSAVLRESTGSRRLGSLSSSHS